MGESGIHVGVFRLAGAGRWLAEGATAVLKRCWLFVARQLGRADAIQGYHVRIDLGLGIDGACRGRDFQY